MNRIFEKVMDELSTDEEDSDWEDTLDEMVAALFNDMGFLDLSGCYPDGLSALFEDEAPEAVEQGLYDLCCAWLYHTNAGLLWRTWIELEGVGDGYENTFWPELAKVESCGFDQIDIVCDLPLLDKS